MRKILSITFLFLLLNSYFLIQSHPVRADWLSELLFGVETLNITKKLNDAIDATLPSDTYIPASAPIPSGSPAPVAAQAAQPTAAPGSGGEDTIYNAAGGYGTIECTNSPCPTPVPSDVGSFLQGLFSLLGLSDVAGYGNDEAQKYASSQLPAEAARTVRNRFQSTTGNLASQPDLANPNVLGLQLFSQPAMVWSYDFKLCQNLPVCLGECCDSGTLASLPQVTPTAISTIAPLASPTPGVIIGFCPAGSGFCSESFIRSTLINTLKVNPAEVTDAKVKNASQICMKESAGFPFALNDHCLASKWPIASKRTLDYSMGLFQINALYQCPLSRPTITPSPPTCTFGNTTELNKCTLSWVNPVENIRQMWRISSGGTNWKPWSAAKACGITGLVPTPTSPGVQIVGCPAPSSRIWVPNTQYKKLLQSLGCMKPSMIVIHWSAAWTDAEATFNTLNIITATRPWLHGCQYATDKNHQLQMQDFWTDAVVWGYCVGGDDNARSLNDEITGSYFDELVDNNYQLITTHPRYAELKTETDRSIVTTCWALKKYNIPKTRVIGHFESAWGASSGKIDPGVKYMQYYRNRVNNECI